jgi:hypothetical protein
MLKVPVIALLALGVTVALAGPASRPATVSYPLFSEDPGAEEGIKWHLHV